MKQLTIGEFVSIISNSNKIFGVEFVKKDNTIRKMAARRGVYKGVINEDSFRGSAARPMVDAVNQVLTVYDMNKRDGNTKGAFRRINLKTLRRVRINYRTYEYDPETNLLKSISD